MRGAAGRSFYPKESGRRCRFGGINTIEFDADGTLTGCADPRRTNAAAGYQAIGQVYPLQEGAESLFSTALLMQKTKKSVAKRFKISAKGKLIRRTPGFRHLLSAKSTKSKRRASRDKLVDVGHAPALLRCLPFGL
jgi:large subunit ribosomal protein L35